MAKIWLRLKTAYLLTNRNNQQVRKLPGDWVEVSKQEAIRLLRNGQADFPDTSENREVLAEDLRDCGILIRGGNVKIGKLIARKYNIPIEAGDIALKWPRTLIWHTRKEVSAQRATVGFDRISKRKGYDAWDMAAVMAGRNLLAADTGSPKEHKKTLRAIGDLRLPVYDTSAIWVRRTPESQKVLDAWIREIDAGADEEHAFLRALYLNPLNLCTLPAHWLYKWANIDTA